LSKKTDKKLLKELRKIAENISSKVEVVSTETEEGEQFHNLSGMGAILRFKV
jgi:stalled ribosome rescue protein Dom34